MDDEPEAVPVRYCMIEPMMRVENAGYVPFSSAVLWVMTNGGNDKKDLLDSEGWNEAVTRLLPFLSTGEIQAVGVPAIGGPPETVPSVIFAGVLVEGPLRDSLDILVSDTSWIGTFPFIDKEHWERGFNDQVFLRKATPAAWTRLQVKKNDVLKHISVGPNLTSPQSALVSNTSASRADRPAVQGGARGRKPGEGSYAKVDAPLLAEMSRLLDEGKVASPEEAARQVAPRALGGGTLESKTERLAKRFRQNQSLKGAE